MHRFFSPSEDVSKDTITIRDKEQLHHMRDVLRLKVGEKIAVFDEKANAYNCSVRELKNVAVLTINEKLLPENEEDKIHIAIACALPKKSKMEDIIDKLTQLGVDRIIPLETERVIVKLDKKKKDLRLLHWQKVALNAAQQSQRRTIPIIEPVKKLKVVLSESAAYGLKIIPTLIRERKLLKDVIASFKPKNILALIGPEGDFTLEEVDLAIRVGFIPVTLGETVLRVDTAAIAVASFLRLYENH